MDNKQKAINLFSFIKALNEIRLKTITDVGKQIYHLQISDIPINDDYVAIYYRDRVEEDDVDSNFTLICITKPEFQLCPKPGNALLIYLESGWDDFKKEALLKTDELNKNEEEKIRKINEEYKSWLDKRNEWRKKQIELDKIRKLFSNLVLLHYELETNSETEEMVVANGYLLDSANSEVNHPILTKRVKTKFDEDTNSVYIMDTDNDSELYISMLRSFNDFNHDQILNLNTCLAEIGYHPMDRNDTPEFLKRVTHSLSTDSYFSNEGIPENWSRNSRFLVYSNPSIIVRKKIDGSIKAIELIIDNIKKSGRIPEHILEILSAGKIELPEEISDNSIERKLAAAGGEDVDIFLSKEANREQLEIAQRIEKFNAVLVQGPPGTGKTHTIANLLGHFLAQGKNVLVTSHTSKALTVLKDQINPNIQNLCVSLLNENSIDMEKSIDGITDFMGRHNSISLKREMQTIGEERKNIIDELAKNRKKLFNLIHQECKTIVINGEDISPSDAAKFISENQNLSYIPGEVVKNIGMPLTFDELLRLYKTNELITKDDELELGYEIPNPNELLDPSDFDKCCETKDITNRKIEELQNGRNLKIEFAPSYNKGYFSSQTGMLEMDLSNKELISEFNNYVNSFKTFKPWMLMAAVDGKKGGVYVNRWNKLIDQINKTVSISELVIEESFGRELYLADLEYNKQVKESLQKIKEKFDKNGKISKLDKALNKTIGLITSEIKVNNREISSSDEVDLIINTYELNYEREKCNKYWDELITINNGPKFMELDSLYPEQAANKWIEEIDKYLHWYEKDYAFFVNYLDELGLDKDILFENNPIDTEEIIINKELIAISEKLPLYLESCSLYFSTVDANRRISDMLITLGKGKRSKSDLCIKLVEAIKSSDEIEYAKLYGEVTNLFNKYNEHHFRIESLKKIESVAPMWAEAIRKRDGIHGESIVPNAIEKAWKWKQYSEAVSDILSEPYDTLIKKCSLLSKQYRDTTARYAEKSAWYHLLLRTESDKSMQQSLIGWKQTIKKIGKGTGNKNRIATLRAEAKKMMSICQEAVPAWIMTIGKAMESLDPRRNIFDVIIIDEASQSDLSSMAILYMAKKIIVVGDDKQVSPMAVGVEVNQVENLISEYLKGTFEIAHLCDPKTSIYDIAATTFQPLTLIEHFRCVPEIINYSNMLSYDWKIKPLRDASSSNILPATVCYRVDGIQKNTKTNEEEARAIVALIKSCCEQPEYDGKTFGVITLLGEVQAKNIQRILFEELGAKEYQKRKILCGNSANFQGDERDIIFISMVDSNEGEGPLPKREFGPDESYRKRYNVAVSRAKDQLWLVTSLDTSKDLKPGDIRKQLIDYVKNPHYFEVEKQNIEKQADSPFEVEVVSKLKQMGYNIVQQWQVGSYYIDMVVISGNRKMAIECDGERYHGEDKTASDMERQTILERIGWKFIRIRGSEYYSNKDQTINRVVNELEENNILPEDNSLVLENTDEPELLTRVKQKASEFLRTNISVENNIDTIAYALDNSDDDIEKNDFKQILTNLEKKDGNHFSKNTDSIGKEELHNNVKNKQNKKVNEDDFITKLKNKGFEVIDNRQKSQWVYIIASANELQTIKDCVKDVKYISMRYERRGIIPTNNRPAWAISFK